MFSGEIDFQFIDSTAGTPLLQAARCAAAVTSGQRVPGVDLPTMAEAAGIAEFDIAPVWGVLLPAGAPQPIVARLESWFAEISKMDATRQYLANTYAAPFPGNAKALADFIPKEIKKWESSRDSRRSSPSEIYSNACQLLQPTSSNTSECIEPDGRPRNPLRFAID